MIILCCIIALVLVNGQVQEAEDFDFIYSADEGSYEFIYKRDLNMLWVVHNDGCYFAQLDDSYSTELLSDFSQSLRGQVISAVTGSGTVQPEGTTEDEVTTMFPDPVVQFNVSTVCDTKDFYLIYPDIYQCDFEESTCAWKESQRHTLLWQRHSGPTATVLTGPEDDHTKQDGTGYYLYVESTLGTEGHRADIVSPIIRSPLGSCLRLWYYMYGEDIGRLQIFHQRIENQHKVFLLDIKEDRGNGWHLAEMRLPNNEGQVHIQATVRDGQRGDIAIDDISSTTGPCTHALLSCSLDEPANQLCSWHQTTALDDMQWTLRQGSTPTENTGPDDDQSPRNGTYLYLEGNNGQPGDAADLESSLLQNQGPICFSFYYYMVGSGVGELDVIQRVRTESDVTDTVLWNKVGQQHRRWYLVKITVAETDPDTTIQLVIRATRGSSAVSDIAIDTIKGVSGTCEDPIIG